MKQKALTQTLKDWYRHLIRHSKYRWLILLGTLLYLVSPIDIAPDVLPIVGWLDDGLVATLLVTEVSQLLFEQLTDRKNKVKPTEDKDINTADVIDVKAVSVG